MIEVDEYQFFFNVTAFAVMRVPWILDRDREHIYEQLYAQMMGWA